MPGRDPVRNTAGREGQPIRDLAGRVMPVLEDPAMTDQEGAPTRAQEGLATMAQVDRATQAQGAVTTVLRYAETASKAVDSPNSRELLVDLRRHS